MLVWVASGLVLGGCGGAEEDSEPAGTPEVEPKALIVAARGHVGERDAQRTTQELDFQTETRATVTLTFHNLRDDSVRDERHVVALRYDAESDSWRVTDDEATYRCHEGRGQQEFGPELCR